MNFLQKILRGHGVYGYFQERPWKSAIETSMYINAFSVDGWQCRGSGLQGTIRKNTTDTIKTIWKMNSQVTGEPHYT